MASVLATRQWTIAILVVLLMLPAGLPSPLSPARAQSAPTISLDPTEGPPGTEVTVQGSGLIARDTIFIHFKAQIAGVGAALGMGIDFFATLPQKEGPQTAINSLATLITNTITAVGSATTETGIPNPPELPVAVGLWAFVGVMGFMMLFGSLEKDAT